MNASLNEKLGSVKWGKYRIGDLFCRIETRKLPYKADELPNTPTDQYTLPCLTSSFNNQGLNYYAPREGSTVLKHVISIPSNSDVYRAYYQSREFTVLSDAYAIRWKSDDREITAAQYLFMVMCINKVTDLPIYSYKNKLGGWNVVQNKYIQLPETDDGVIDFNFMESFIAELEAERIAELEAYLEVSGLNNTEFSIEEKNALVLFQSGKLPMAQFEIGTLFNVESSKKRFDANKVVLFDRGGYPYVVRMGYNNGHKGQICEDEAFLNEANTISFGQDTATIFYQSMPYFTGDKIKIMKSKELRFQKHNALFFVAAMNKTFSSFSWGTQSFNVSTLKKQKIWLPTIDGDIDYSFLNTLTIAIQKLVITDVVLYTGRRINATKSIIGNNSAK